jgi:phosphohistidine phosphatase
MKVLLVRHGKAVARGTPGIEENDRPLTREGEESFRQAAAGIVRLVERPAALLASPLPRAFRTAEILAEAWGKIAPLEAPALAGGSFVDVAELLAGCDPGATVALVGHEPHLSGLLARLLGADGGEALPFRKGGAALVELPGPPSKGGSLVWFIPPKVLKRLARD